MTDSEYFSYSLTDSSFISNNTSYGGVAHIRSASVTATDCTFTLNVAHVYGGAAQVLGSGTFTANDCFFSNNQAPSSGDDVHNDGTGTVDCTASSST